MAKLEGKALNYGWEKLFVAVDGMARSRGSLQERLRDAYVSSLIRLGPGSVPADEEDRLAEIAERLTSVPAKGDEGTVAATTAVMSDEDARQLIEKIVASTATSPRRSASSGSAGAAEGAVLPGGRWA